MRTERPHNFFVFVSTYFLILAFSTTAHGLDQWIGTAPFCDASPRDCSENDMSYVMSSTRGDGVRCTAPIPGTTGRKVLCTASGFAIPFRNARDANRLSVLSWNVLMRPEPLNIDNNKRTNRIANLIDAPDVVVLNELFEERQMRKIAQKFPYHTSINTRPINRPGVGFSLQDSGVFLFSNWQFVGDPKYIIFNSCNGSDCLANKGAVMVKINKLGRIYTVIATHLQADVENRYTRANQLAEIKRYFIDDSNNSFFEPIILAGDLNIRLENTAGSEYLQLVQSLNMTHGRESGLPFTFNPLKNKLARKFGGVSQFLDYILFSDIHERPREASMQVVRLLPNVAMDGDYADLSDHYAVYSEFSFEPISSRKYEAVVSRSDFSSLITGSWPVFVHETISWNCFENTCRYFDNGGLIQLSPLDACLSLANRARAVISFTQNGRQVLSEGELAACNER